MRAVVITGPGGPEVLKVQDVPDPEAEADEVVIQVSAAGVNRADLGQRAGNHPPPAGASLYPGLECSGTIIEIGSNVDGWKVGEEVSALLSGGGYAERVAVPAAQLFSANNVLSLVDSGGLPETACTVHSMIFNGEISPRPLRANDTFLVHGGSSGIGTTAIQMAKAIGATVAVTVGDDRKVDVCRDLGADLVINYQTDDFSEAVLKAFGGADVILDVVGAPYLNRNIRTLKEYGRLAMIGQLGGSQAEIDLSLLQSKQGIFHAAGLRARSARKKAEIVAATRSFIGPFVNAGQLRPIIGEVLPLADAAMAHEIVGAGRHIGKVLLRV